MRTLLKSDLQFDWKVVTITVVSTLLLMVDYYYPITEAWLPTPWWKYIDRTILYLVIPLLIIVLVFREQPREYGFVLGDWRAGMALTALSVLVFFLLALVVGRCNHRMRSYYQGGAAGLPWTTFLDLFGWEFLFRGWVLFGYARKFGPEALWLQAVPFAMAHISKPDIETLSTVFGGFFFGWIAWRTRSFLYPFLIHWFLATAIILVSAGLG
ncbi:MAG: CPBP family intramembrane metalloprotease [Anaerolineales bacterium]|nr:CPBP family intramembrane metalloprotease [Anaerolineales bacterium]